MGAICKSSGGVTLLEMLMAFALTTIGAVVALRSCSTQRNLDDRALTAENFLQLAITPVEVMRQDLKVATTIAGTPTALNLGYSYFNEVTQMIENRMINYTLADVDCSDVAPAMICKRMVRTDTSNGVSIVFARIRDFVWCIDNDAAFPACPAIARIPTTQPRKRFVGSFAFITSSAQADSRIPFVVDLENIPMTLGLAPNQVHLLR